MSAPDTHSCPSPAAPIHLGACFATDEAHGHGWRACTARGSECGRIHACMDGTGRGTKPGRSAAAWPWPPGSMLLACSSQSPVVDDDVCNDLDLVLVEDADQVAQLSLRAVRRVKAVQVAGQVALGREGGGGGHRKDWGAEEGEGQGGGEGARGLVQDKGGAPCAAPSVRRPGTVSTRTRRRASGAPTHTQPRACARARPALCKAHHRTHAGLAHTQEKHAARALSRTWGLTESLGGGSHTAVKPAAAMSLTLPIMVL